MKNEEYYDTAKRYGEKECNGLQQEAEHTFWKENSYVVQKYVREPALWQGHKFDFRIYVLITSVVDPMQIFLYNDGLVRLASEKYTQKNMHDHFIHLTNYSLNKQNENFNEQVHKLKVSDCLRGQMS